MNSYGCIYVYIHNRGLYNNDNKTWIQNLVNSYSVYSKQWKWIKRGSKEGKKYI